ncbi:UNVERIFIED_ORG: hypothetical protein ABIC43_000231 [Variovorax guangxiensis]
MSVGSWFRFGVVCVLVCLLAAFSGLASATISPVYKWWPESKGQGTLYDTPDAACAAGTGPSNNLGPSPPTKTSDTEYACKWVVPFGSGTAIGGSDTARRTSSQLCPANSSLSGGQCLCSVGFEESNGQCVPKTNKCTAGMNKPRTVNWTLGWTRTPDDTDTRWVGGDMSVPTGGGVACVEGCEVDMNLTLSGPPQKSQVPAANGLYRVTAPFEGLGRGKECTANTESAEKSTPIKACPGYVGEVDGKLGCYGTAEKPVTTTDKPIPGASGSTGTIIAGNPPAGTPASSGVGPSTGAGRTPTTGTGGNDGGPAAAATGGKGGGAGGAASGTGATTNAEGKEEKDPCGAPGQAQCNVKVDEKGTPEGGGEGMKTTALDQAMDKAVEGLQKATNPGGMDTSWGGIPAWFNSESCTPWQLGTLPIINQPVTLNICVIQPYVIAVMTFLWVVGTFFAIVGMVARVMGSGVH